jgi:hypothetical protein
MATSNYKEEKCNFAMNPEDGAYLWTALKD